jgi:hypothetical protein
MILNAGELLDSHSQGRGRWFDPSIAHSEKAVLDQDYATFRYCLFSGHSVE